MVEVDLSPQGVPPIVLAFDGVDGDINAVSIQQGESIIWIPISELQKFTAAFDVFKLTEQEN